MAGNSVWSCRYRWPGDQQHPVGLVDRRRSRPGCRPSRIRGCPARAVLSALVKRLLVAAPAAPRPRRSVGMIETRKSTARRVERLETPVLGRAASVMRARREPSTREMACSACLVSWRNLICERMPSMRNLITNPAAIVSCERRSRLSSARRAGSANQPHDFASILADRLSERSSMPRVSSARCGSARTASSARRVSS